MSKIKMSLSRESIRAAVRELEDYSRWLNRKARELGEALAWLGAEVAKERFGAAMYDGDGSVEVTVGRARRDNANVWTISAAGQAVAFIEFGAGVYYNPTEPYPNRPANIAHIGEYGKGYGKRPIWVYYDDSMEKHFTRGNPAAMPMFHASEEMRAHITETARTVFSRD